MFEQPFASSRIQLSAMALANNVAFARGFLDDGTRLSMVIKGNAYGHGIEEMVELGLAAGIDHFSVASADEAYRAWRALEGRADLMVMTFMPDVALDWAVENGVSFFLFDPLCLREIKAAAKRANRPARLHLELETGMNRTGLDAAALREVLDELQAHPDLLRIDGTCTHLAGAESVANHIRIREQMKRFDAGCAAIVAAGLRPGVRHMASSSATLTLPESRLDLVRVGILLYGFWPSQEIRTHCMMQSEPEGDLSLYNPLIRVMRWETRIMSLKRVVTGDFVGYGISYQAQRPLMLASVPIGYYHGFSRGLSNLGYVLVNGNRAPVVGYVNMNLMMVDISHCGDVAPGDTVVVIGRQLGEEISVAAFSEMSQLMNYELLTRIPTEIPRRIED